MHFLAHGARIADDPPSPFKHTLTFRGKPLETGAAVDQHYPEGLLELFYPRRQSRLGDTTSFGGPAKMLLTSQCEEKFQFIEQLQPRSRSKLAVPLPPPGEPSNDWIIRLSQHNRKKQGYEPKTIEKPYQLI
jgi:hypothetical protein